jgi:hypothetical protein
VLPRQVRFDVEVAPQAPLVLMACVLESEQVPKSLWQPGPQYAGVEPQ